MVKIAVASGKGGTGKTFVATNIFHTLLNNRYNATLVDCDAEAPNAGVFFKKRKLTGKTEVFQMVPVIDPGKCTYCGKCREYCNYNAIFIIPPARIINVMEDLCHGCGACSLACEYGAISEKPSSLGVVTKYKLNDKAEITEARMKIGVMSPVPVIKSALKQADKRAEVVIIDSPPGTSCPFIQTVAGADYIILVTEPTPFGLSDLVQSVETLRIMRKSFGTIINRAGLGNNHVVDYLREEKIPLLLEIPFSKDIAKIHSRGELVTAKNPQLAGQLKEVIEDIIGSNGTGSYKR